MHTTTTKNSHSLAAALALALLAGAGVSSAQAAVYTWNFSSPAGAQNSTMTYWDTTHSFTITAMGFLTTVAQPAAPVLGRTWGSGSGFNYNAGTITAKNLYGKNGGAGETGLGLDVGGDFEIDNRSFVQLDVGNLIANGFLSMTAIIESVQASEGFSIWGSNSSGTPGTLLYNGGNPSTGGNTQVTAIPSFGTYRYISLSASATDVLLGDGLRAVTPAPGSLALLGFGGMVATRRRR
jgi:hypothetical protein